MSFVFVLIDRRARPLSQCLLWPPYYRGGPGSSVGIATGPGSLVGIATELRAGRYGDRILVGARFSA